MSTLSKIGLPKEASKTLAKKLNKLLSNYQLFYMNSRGFHWNIKGDKFFELHVKFEELYNDSQIKIDEIAERILTLGYTPIHSYSNFLKEAKIKEATNVTDGINAVKEILKGYSVLLPMERELLDLSDKHNDEGTNALMSDYIREQEKLVWMYSAYISGSK